MEIVQGLPHVPTPVPERVTLTPEPWWSKALSMVAPITTPRLVFAVTILAMFVSACTSSAIASVLRAVP